MSLVINNSNANLARTEPVRQYIERRCYSPLIDEAINRTSIIFCQVVFEINILFTMIKNDLPKYVKLFRATFIASMIYHTIFALTILRTTSR